MARLSSPQASIDSSSLSRQLAAVALLPRLLRLIWTSNMRYASGVIALRLGRSLLPVAVLAVAKRVVDLVIQLARGNGDAAEVWRLLAVEMFLVVASDLLARLSSLLESMLSDLFSHRVSLLIMEHAATLDLEHFENPDFYDHLERARQSTTSRSALIGALLGVVQSLSTVVSLIIALAVRQPLLVGLLILTVLPGIVGEVHFARRAYQLLYRRTPERRELEYLRYVGASAATAKEVQLLELSPWLTTRFRNLSRAFYRETTRIAINRTVVTWMFSLLATAGYYGGYVMIVRATIAGALSVGMLTFLAGSFRQSRDLLQSVLLSAGGILEQCMQLVDLFGFLDMKPRAPTVRGERRVPKTLHKGFAFENVSFRYPDAARWALRDVSFALAADERIAFVGENGAGKTTITKLITGLYEPTEGRVLLNGIDIREYDRSSLRRSIGVIFQDFARYDMRFDENVAVGYASAMPELREGMDISGTSPAVERATEQAQATAIVQRLPSGYRQMLGRRFEGGVELSGGEWQKVALARAYMRDARLVILDEPTSALDARAEYEVFLRFNSLMQGRMAVLISHRFSTVRMADRIFVLQNGSVAEEGRHSDLLGRQSLYSELFELQAAGYR